jgi:hypothetical protein
MSFLDNLENSLKSLENEPTHVNTARDKDRRKADVAAQNAVAPWAEQLKKSSYTETLLNTATREGFKLRMKVYITWLGAVLRLEARERRMELRPAPNGIRAVFHIDAVETRSQMIDLKGDPADLVRQWLA